MRKTLFVCILSLALSFQSLFSVQIEKGTRESLKVMHSLVEENAIDFSEITLLVVQHIKHNSIEFIRLLKKSGFKDVIVIGKPYSCNEEALKKMRSFVTVHVPSSTDLESLKIVDQVARPLIETNSPFVCLDLGGYFSRYFHQCEVCPESLIGVVEDTKNGIWFPHTQPPQLQFPLLSVASSHLKDYAEHYFVAKAILRSSENLLMNTFQETLTGKKILLIGYGHIGHNIAKILKTEAIVTVYDIDPIQITKAKIDGYSVITDYQDLTLFDVIIGITGEYVLGHELTDLKDHVFLVNGSTRQKEFDFNSVQSQVRSAKDFSTFKQVEFLNGQTAYLLAHGFPVNFFQTESTPEYILDIVFSEMYLLLQKCCMEKLVPGYYPIEEKFIEDEQNIATRWLKYGS